MPLGLSGRPITSTTSASGARLVDLPGVGENLHEPPALARHPSAAERPIPPARAGLPGAAVALLLALRATGWPCPTCQPLAFQRAALRGLDGGGRRTPFLADGRDDSGRSAAAASALRQLGPVGRASTSTPRHPVRREADLETLVAAVEKCRSIGTARRAGRMGRPRAVPRTGPRRTCASGCAGPRSPITTRSVPAGMGTDELGRRRSPSCACTASTGWRVGRRVDHADRHDPATRTRPALMIGERVADLRARHAGRAGGRGRGGPMTVLVTGGTGVIGAHVRAARLVSGGRERSC